MKYASSRARQLWSSGLPALLAVAATLHIAILLWPRLEVSGFARPSGWVAGSIMGTPVTTLPDCGLSLDTEYGPVTVSKACSGFDFFVLLFAATSWLRLRTPGTRQSRNRRGFPHGAGQVRRYYKHPENPHRSVCSRRARAVSSLVLRHPKIRRFATVACSGLLASYFLALAINAGRLILAVHTQAWTLRCLGEGFTHATHLTVGVLSFLPVLLIACSLLERSTAREC